MDKPRLYLLALFAMQTDPGWQPAVGAEPSRVHRAGSAMPMISLWAQGVVAHSDEDARAAGLQVLLETCPPEEGWINHAVAANTIAPDTFERIVRDVT